MARRPKNNIRRVQIKNVRSIPQLDQRFALNRGESQWIIVLGDNGSGKTTFLRALALAILPLDVAQAVVHSAKPPVSYVLLNAKEGEVTVDLNVPLAVRFRPRGALNDPNNTLLGEANSLSDERPFIVAYGSQRGSALGKGRSYSGRERPQDCVLTLFDETAELIRAEEWLQGLDYTSLVARPLGEAAINSAKKAVQGLLLNVDEIKVSPSGVTVVGPDGEVPLPAMSDGYLTTIGWVIDMMARWMDFQKRREPSKPSILDPKEMNGIVLLDEIDLHLHPKWQTQIVELLRSTFPRMTFVVTTHSALTVLSARPGELHVLERDPETAVVSMVQKDVRPGMTADEILTGEWFDLSATTDPDTLDKLQEHAELLRANTPESDPRRQALERELRRRLSGFSDTSADRMAQSVAAEVIDQDVRTLSFAERAEAREKILAVIKERQSVK